MFSDVLISEFHLFSSLTLSYHFSLYEVFKVHSTELFLSSGDEEIRTLDPLLARQVLSQLSYIPIRSGSHLLSHTVSSAVPSAA